MEKKLRGYTESSVTRALSFNVEFVAGETINNVPVRHAAVVRHMGIRKLGMLDFLVNHCGYSVQFRMR